MKVDLETLKRAYESLQEKENPDDCDSNNLDPDEHLYVISAFDMPSWHWSPERGAFER